MWRKYGLGSIGLLICAALVYSLSSGTFFDHLQTEPKLSADSLNAEVTQKELKIKLTPQTEIIQKIKYTKCGDEEITRAVADQKLIGLSFQQVRSMYPGWTIETFDTKEVVLTLAVDGYCKQHSEYMFLGIHNEHVAIYAGKPGPQALLKEATNISLQDLQPQDRVELEKGIVIKDRAELLQTLEGLQEHR